MTVVALDSNVLVGLLSPTDALHNASTEAVGCWERQGAGFVTSAVSWAEVLTGVLRQGRMDESEFRTLVEEVTDVAPVDVTTASAAARLRHQDRALRTPDALIVAAARQLSAAALLTGDRKLRRVDPELVQVISW